MIYIFYLASGNSRRYNNQNKLLTDFSGKPLYRHGLDTLQHAVLNRSDCKIIVVSRYDDILQYAKDNNIDAVYSEDSIKGVSYSIKDGLKSVDRISHKDYISFMVADQPFLRSATIQEMLDTLTEEIEILSLCHDEKLGNPKVFSGRFGPGFYKLTGDEGGKEIVKNHRVKKLQVASSIELLDIDTEDDLNFITNIFITGSVKVGKTTLIRNVMTRLEMSYNGYLTLPRETGLKRNTYDMKDMQKGISEPISEHSQGLFKGIERTFEEFGVCCIRECLENEVPYVVLDEIGRFESRCVNFLNMLEQAFDSSKIVIAVLKKEPLPHIQAYRARNDSVVLDLDKMSMREAEEQFIHFLHEKNRLLRTN